MSESFEAIDPDLNYFSDVHNSSCTLHSVEEFALLSQDNNFLNILNYNIRSFHSNSNTFLPIIGNSKPHILVLTETWFTEDYHPPIVNYEAYHSIRSSRSGGVSVYVLNNLNSRKIADLSYVNENIEVCTVEINLHNEKLYVVGIYRPHSGTTENFCLETDILLQNSLLRNKRTIVTGDFNICLMQNNSDSNRLSDIMQSLHYFQTITQPTRYPPHENQSPSLLDHMWYNALSIYKTGIISHADADHLPTFLQILMPDSMNLKNNDLIKITFRLNNESNRDRFSQLIDDFDWASVASDDVDVYVENFTRKLDEIYCSAFPIKTKCIPRHKAMNPWFSPELKELTNYKSVYFNMFRLGIISKQENNRFKNKIKCKIEETKISYYRRLFEKNLSNARLTWETLNNLMDRRSSEKLPKSIVRNGVEIHDDETMANIFNDYLSNLPLQLDRDVPLSNLDPLHFVNPNIASTLVNFSHCTPTEISDIINNLKITREGKNSVPIKLIKANKSVLSVVICHMINQAFSMGTFPRLLKIGIIVPIFKKKGEKNEVSNYRPITKLPFLSKIFEKVIYSRLMNHFLTNNIISPYQFGFQKNVSTLDAIIHFTEFLYSALNNKQSCINIFIDYARAFETVNHEILIRKLERYGVQGNFLSLIASFLKDRSQSVCINGKFSNNIVTNISVPQGSVVGPLLFLVYVMEIPLISNHFMTTIFADDCTLSIAGNDLDQLIYTCNAELATFKAWSDANRLTINLNKTNCLFISNIHNSLPEDSILVEDHVLDITHCVKFLGLFIDDELKFNMHIQHICSKVSKSIGIIFRIRSLVPKSLLRNIYFSIVQPYFLYCLPAFASTYLIHLDPLIKLQKRAIRAMSVAGFLDHTEPLFFQYKILKLNDQFKLSLACHLFNNQNLLTEFSRSHTHYTRNRDVPLAPVARLRSTEQSIIRNAILLWDTIPINIKACRTINSFKLRYKYFLLNQYSSPVVSG